MALASACGEGGGRRGAPPRGPPRLQRSPRPPNVAAAGFAASAFPRDGEVGRGFGQKDLGGSRRKPGNPEAIEARALLGAELYDGGKSAEAERVYRELLARNPEHVSSLVALAQILIDRDDLEWRRCLIERALKANPNSIPALQKKIALLVARDQAAEA